MKEIYIHGFRVKYEDNVKSGVEYLLYDLDREEAKVFFNQAKAHRYAEFEDDKEGQYTISYNGSDSYTLVRR